NHPVAVRWSPDGRTVAVLEYHRGESWFVLRDSVALKERSRLEGRNLSPEGPAFSPDGRLLACGTRSNTVSIYDTDTGRVRANLTRGAGFVTYVAFAPDGRALAAGETGGTVRVWDLARSEPVGEWDACDHPVSGLAFGPDGRTLAVTTHNRPLTLWEVAT